MSILSPPAPTSPRGIELRKAQHPHRDHLKGTRDHYDLIVIGSGLAGLTAANRIARNGYSVLLLEQHYNFGGMATWFKRQNGHIFDISLHGFPVGMIKTCRKYWTKEIADSIVRLRSIRFDNPQFQLETTYDKADFTRALEERFGIEKKVIDAFFTTVRGMNFYDDQTTTTGQLFERFFPGRSDVWRLLMEPIAYANGSTLDDPAITYGIVFSNFMSDGVYTFQGGTNVLIKAMKDELTRNGVDIRNYAQVEQILVEGAPGEKRAIGVIVNGKRIRSSAIVSNANVRTTIHKLVGEEHWPKDFISESRAVRMNNSSSQVYIGIKQGETIPYVGELLFSSSAPEFDSTALCALACSSRTFSFYYPEIRPGTDRYTVVASINSNYSDWSRLSDEEYERQKEKLAVETIGWLEKYVPGVRPKIDHVEVSTPRTFKYFTQHEGGASFGTKFEGLKVSQSIPKHLRGLFHAGSVGIIMSGWLGAANYGVIVANEVDRFLHQTKAVRRVVECSTSRISV
jgi:phytoene dehydrogenase-like protein